MMHSEKTVNDDEAQADSTKDDVGDVETAGETTAADTISGPPDTTPVGADTMVKVADAPDENGSADG
jgi:hypothetical protein